MAHTERQLVAHLLRRAGFGASAADLDAYAELGFEGAVDRLVNYGNIDDSEMERTIAGMRAQTPGTTNNKHPEFGNPALEIAIFLSRMLLSRRPLQEKMTLMWHGWLTSSIASIHYASMMTAQNDLYRANALTTDFKAMLKQVARDPAMLIYLNNNTNVKRAPNENWARELMELFTLGIGNYSEQDVKESARAFTGWTVNGRGAGQQGATPGFLVRPLQHDNGPKTFLGVTGNLNGDDIIDIIFAQPAHGPFVARKVFRFFGYDDPDDATVDRFAGIYVKSRFSIKELVTQILLSPEFRSDRAMFALVKSPAEFTIGALRALSAQVSDVGTWTRLSLAMALMGQQIYAPPNVGGWPGNTAWVNSNAYFARAELARGLVSINSDLTVDPTEIARADDITTPEEAVDIFLDVLVQSDVPSDYRQTLLNFVGSFNGPRDMDGKLRGLVRLIMASPIYQMN
jgi:uncharacterized protein (DUF1800 family)